MAEDLSKRSYIHWQTKGVVEVPEKEEDDINAVCEQINSMQRAQYNNHRHCYTGTHSRTQGIVKVKVIVKDDLPPHLKQSMFAHGGSYPTVCRYSTEPGDPGIDVSTKTKDSYDSR